ncbi:MAG: MFS transporter [Anaerolineae bacterium]|nr:MFS transporter [Anaerolineae bacterium]
MAKNRSLRTFYILLLTQTFSLIGSRMTGLAVGIKVYQDTDQVTPLALVAFFSALPTVLSASVAGVLADRWDRRKVMAVADAGQAVGTLILLVSFATGTFELWMLYVVAVITSVFGIFQGPAFQASVTMLVPDDHRDRANAIQQLTGPSAGVIAPILAGALFAVIGATGVMTIDLLTFGVAITVVLLVHIPRPEQTAEGAALQPDKVWKEALVGLRFLMKHRMLLALTVSATIANFLIGGAMVMNTPYILTLTHNDEALLGTLLGVMSAGPVVGGILMSVWGGTRPRIHTILPGIALEGVLLVIYGVTRSPLALGVALFFLLMPIPIVNASFMSLMQLKVPPDLQGRVFSTLTQTAMLLTPLTYLLAGQLADHVFEPAVGGAHWGFVEPLVGSVPGSGMGLMMVIYGAMMLMSMSAIYALPSIRRVEAILPDYVPVVAADGDAADTVPDSVLGEGELAPAV